MSSPDTIWIRRERARFTPSDYGISLYSPTLGHKSISRNPFTAWINSFTCMKKVRRNSMYRTISLCGRGLINSQTAVFRLTYLACHHRHRYIYISMLATGLLGVLWHYGSAKLSSSKEILTNGESGSEQKYCSRRLAWIWELWVMSIFQTDISESCRYSWGELLFNRIQTTCHKR